MTSTVESIIQEILEAYRKSSLFLPLPMETQKDIIADYQSGRRNITVKDILRKYNLPVTAQAEAQFNKFLDRHGIPRNRSQKNLDARQRRELSPEDDKEIIADYLSRMPLVDIYRKYNITKKIFDTVLDDYEIRRGRRDKKYDYDQILADYEDDMPQEEIMRKHEISQDSTLFRILRIMKATPLRNMDGRAKYRKSKKLHLHLKDIISSYEQGQSPQVIAKRYNVGHKAIRHTLEDAGVDMSLTAAYRKLKYYYTDIVRDLRNGVTPKKVSIKYRLDSRIIKQVVADDLRLTQNLMRSAMSITHDYGTDSF